MKDIIKLGLFKLTASVTLNTVKLDTLVLAKDEEQAKCCMTSGSDSLWVSVATCEPIGTLEFDSGALDGKFYENCGGFVIA